MSKQPNKQYHQALTANRKLLEENALLKEKVKKLECDAETSYRESMNDEYDLDWLNKINNGLMRDKEKLQAQVERLTKAGDAMLPLLGRGDYDIARNDWNAAKDGKQSK